MKNILLIISLALTIHLFAQNLLLIPDTLLGINFELNLGNGAVNFYEGQVTTTFLILLID